MQYDVRRLLEPTALDWDWLPIPAAFTPLYVPIRVVRLALGGLARAGGHLRVTDDAFERKGREGREASHTGRLRPR